MGTDEWVDDGAIEGSNNDFHGQVDSATESVNDDDQDPLKLPLLHASDVSHFLKLCAALQVLLRGCLTDADITNANCLIRTYCEDLIEVSINQIYICAIVRIINMRTALIAIWGRCSQAKSPLCYPYRGICPRSLHGFWTFISERMNKILKSYMTNNHGSGELKTTFFQEFQRTVRTSRVVCNFIYMVQVNLTIMKLAQGSQAPTSSGLPHAVRAIYKASADDCGTVQALANELDGVHKHSRFPLQFIFIVEV